MAKAFAWSFSKIKNFEKCPKRYYEVDVAKTYKETEGEALLWGNQVHAALAAAITGKAPLPESMALYQKWVDRVRAGPGQLVVEQKYAITKALGRTEWFAPNAWYRGIGDVVRVHGKVALVLDWKTGKVDPDSVQLALMAQCVFANFPDVQRVRSEFVWLAHDTTSPEVYSRADMVDVWNDLLPRVDSLEHATIKQNFPPKPGGLCRKWCVVQSCPYHGK